MNKLCLSLALAAFALGANAEWSKSYDWDDSRDQTWETTTSGGKKYICTGGWEIEYSVANGNEISIIYVKTVGTENRLNFDTVERDTGLRLVNIGAQKFKNKWSTFTSFDLVFPASLAEIGNEAFHTCPFDGDLVFPGKITIVGGAFYYTKAKTVTIKTPGSILDGAVFGGGTGWVGTSDITGVTSIGSSAFARGNNYPTFELLISPAVTNFGSTAFSGHRGLTVTVQPPKLASEVPDVDGVIGNGAFKDYGYNLTDGFTLTIPFRGGCTVGSQAFNWMLKCGNFEFWGKAPTIDGNAFSSIGNSYSYKKRITGCVEMDPDGWTALATPCTAEEKARADYPGDDVCLGTYTSGGGCVFWVCNGTSPYTASATEPVLDEVSVEKTVSGYRVAGSLIQGSAILKAVFGSLEFPITTSAADAPYEFSLTIPVGSGEGQLPAGQMYEVSVVATDPNGGESATWTSETAVSSGLVSVEMLQAATEVHLVSGAFRVSRGEGNTTGDLVVTYIVSGTAVAGTNYEALPGTVTIPDGSSYADIAVVPFFDEEDTEGTTLVLSLGEGNYFVSGTAGDAIMFIASSSGAEKDVFVDSAVSVSGDGSETAPFKTIREGVELARAGFTVHIRGGEGREYVILGDADHIQVPVSKDHLTICKWGDANPLISMTNTFDAAATTGSPFIIAAPDVVLSGLSFTYSYNSLSEMKYGGKFYPIVRFETTAVSNVVEDCEVIRGPWSTNATDNRYCTGQLGLFLELAPCTFRNCRFLSTRSDNSTYQFAPIVLDEASVNADVPCELTGNVFSNCTWIVNCAKGREVITAVSNLFLNCACEVEAASSNGNPTDGLFRGAANSPDSLLLAYNIFYNDATMSGKSKTVLQGCREAYYNGLVAHHNTVIGFDHFISTSNIYKHDNHHVLQFFDNLFVLNDGGSVVNQRWKLSNDSASNVACTFGPNSFIRNNYASCDIDGGTLKTDYEEYDFSNVLVENNIATPAPVFESLDPARSRFCVMSRANNPELTAKSVAWTDGGLYPSYLGAIEPMKNLGSILYFR